VPTVFVARSIGVTLSGLDPAVVTYAVVPSGEMTSAFGLAPTAMGVPATLVATLMGVTLLELWLTTYTVLPSGVTARKVGLVPPVGIGVPAVPVARSIGVTLFDPVLATYAVRPSGVMAIPSGPSPTGIHGFVVFVAMVMGVTVFDETLVT
jgi:hypothetical protein